jgi:riboflavin transporter FmnP
MSLHRLTRLALLAAVAVALYRFSFSLPLFPPFLKYDASEVPVLVATLAYGPLTGLLLEVVKNLLHAISKGGANPSAGRPF